jgi:hypothetical protein
VSGGKYAVSKRIFMVQNGAEGSNETEEPDGSGGTERLDEIGEAEEPKEAEGEEKGG